MANGSIEFRTADASSINRMKQLPLFDFIFIRHQNYWFAPATWDRLLENALAVLAPGGVLACTSYFDGEHDLLKCRSKPAARRSCGMSGTWSRGFCRMCRGNPWIGGWRCSRNVVRDFSPMPLRIR